MNKRTADTGSVPPGARSFGAGVLIGLSIVAPVFAATDAITDDWPFLLLVGSIALLLAGLALKAINVARARKASSPAERIPDMRRDRLAAAAVDHSIALTAAQRGSVDQSRSPRPAEVERSEVVS